MAQHENALSQLQVASKETPGFFTITPELDLKNKMRSDAAAAVAKSWVSDLKEIFFMRMTVTDLVKRLTQRRLRLKLCCENCQCPVGDG